VPPEPTLGTRVAVVALTFRKVVVVRLGSIAVEVPVCVPNAGAEYGMNESIEP
jgi:hypothetical protein